MCGQKKKKKKRQSQTHTHTHTHTDNEKKKTKNKDGIRRMIIDFMKSKETKETKDLTMLYRSRINITNESKEITKDELWLDFGEIILNFDFDFCARIVFILDALSYWAKIDYLTLFECYMEEANANTMNNFNTNNAEILDPNNTYLYKNRSKCLNLQINSNLLTIQFLVRDTNSPFYDTKNEKIEFRFEKLTATTSSV